VELVRRDTRSLIGSRHDGLVDAVRRKVLAASGMGEGAVFPSHMASIADLAAARYQLPKQINKSSASCEYGPGT
jgi:hypothetical protein